jgi:hypothetical protein
MARRGSQGRRCRFESLENRRLLAGDVIAQIKNGDLVIKGDGAANGITITAGATAGTVVITGVDAGGSATNVNGTANGTVTLSGFTDDLKIKMKGGDDVVTITGLTVPDEIDIELGKGADTLTLTDVTASDEADIDGGKGADNITITDSTFDELEVETHRDNDTVSISGTTVHDETELDGGKGTNTLNLGEGNSLGDLDIDDFNTNTNSGANNKTPTVIANAVSPINENNSATLTGSFTDGDVANTHTMTVDWGDPNNNTDSTFAIPATSALSANQTINSSTDSAVLTISAVDTTTGQVTYSVQHKYADDGVAPGNNTAGDVNTISVSVKDSASATGSATTTVTVNNVAPTVALNAVTAITENSSATLTGSYTDIGLSDVHTVTVNWGDPNTSTNSTFSVPATSGLAANQTVNSTSGDGAVLTITAVNTTTGQVTFSVQHKYTDDGVSPGNNTTSDTSTITVTVADDDTGSANTSTTVAINNAPPTVALNATSVTENNLATLTGSFTDAGQSDVHTMTVAWADPNNSTNSTFTVPATKNLTVNQTLTASSADGAVLTITAINTTTGQVSFSVQHKYSDDGVSPGNGTASDPSTVTVTVADDDNQNGSNTTTVTVNNAAPTVALSNVTAITENGTVTLTGSFTDIGVSDVHNMTVNWGDTNNSTNSTFALAATTALAANQTINSSSGDGAVLTITAVNTTTGQVSFSVQHKYTDDGVSPGNGTASDGSTITVTVGDDDTGSGNNTTTATVNNSAPTVALNAVTAITENNTATVTGNFTDIGLSDVHTMTVNWGDANNTTNSTFSIPATKNLTNNQTINSSTDSALLTITNVNTTTGQVTFSVQHKYADDGVAPGNNTASDNSTITVTVADDDTGSGNNTATVTVNNVVPTIALDAVGGINEIGLATLTGSFTDIGLSDVHTLTVNWNDLNNIENSTFTVPATSTLVQNQTINSTTDGAVLTITAVNTTTGQVSYSVQHKYPDDGVSPGNGTTSDSSTISVTVADDDTGSVNTTTTVLVSNVAPMVDLDAVSPINENGTATLTGSFTDVGVFDLHTLTVDWDDPNDTTDSAFDIPATNSLFSGQTLIASAGSGTLTITNVNTATGEVSFSVEHQYTDDGVSPGNVTISDTSTIIVTVLDDDNQGGSDTTTLTVENVAPQISDPADTQVNENSEVTLIATITDTGTKDVFSVDVNWQDGAPDTISGLGLVDIPQTAQGGTSYSWNAATRQLTVKHTYPDDNPTATSSDLKAVTLTPHDDDGGTGATQTVNVTVNNVDPQISDPADTQVNENSEVTLTTTITDPAPTDVFSVDVDWKDGSSDTIPNLGQSDIGSTTVGGTTFTWTAATRQLVLKHTYLDDDPTGTSSDIKAVTITPHDDDLGTGGTQTINVTVNNVAPTVALDAPTSIIEGGTATLTGTFTDSGVSDTHTLVVDWGDGSNVSTFGISATNSLLALQTFNSSTDGATLTITTVNTTTGEVGFSVQHDYTTADTYTITVTVDDDDLGSGLDTTSIDVGLNNP